MRCVGVHAPAGGPACRGAASLHMEVTSMTRTSAIRSSGRRWRSATLRVALGEGPSEMQNVFFVRSAEESIQLAPCCASLPMTVVAMSCP